MTVVTLTTDFGARDPYVAAMKGVVLARCPDAQVVDLTHELAPQDVLEGALFLAAAVPHFPPGTVHVAVVDPGVGTERRPVAVRVAGQVVVCPDNGLLTVLLRAGPLEAARVIEEPRYMRPEVSATFHGRDIFAPAAAALACGEPFDHLGAIAHDLVSLDLPHARREGDAVTGEVLHVDRFGNAITCIARADLPAGSLECDAGGRTLPFGRTYADVDPGEALALVGSAGLVEVAVNRGSAAARLGLVRGSRVTVRPRARPPSPAP